MRLCASRVEFEGGRVGFSFSRLRRDSGINANLDEARNHYVESKVQVCAGRKKGDGRSLTGTRGF